MSGQRLDQFHFACNCGCGTLSHNLGKNYVRLSQGLRWYAKDCVPKDKVSQSKLLGDGYVVREDDF